jgi:hypothetical protein
MYKPFVCRSVPSLPYLTTHTAIKPHFHTVNFLDFFSLSRGLLRFLKFYVLVNIMSTFRPFPKFYTASSFAKPQAGWPPFIGSRHLITQYNCSYPYIRAVCTICSLSTPCLSLRSDPHIVCSLPKGVRIMVCVLHVECVRQSRNLLFWSRNLK